MRKELLLSVVGLAIATIPLGCGRGPFQPPANRSAAGDGAAQPAGTMADKGTLKEEPAPTLPPGYPKDVPIPKDAKVTFSRTKDKTTTVRFETEAPAAEVAAFYNTSLTALGWEILAATRSESGSAIGARKGGRTLSVTVVKGQPVTLITVGLSGP